jgi:hypothetical protein
MASGGPVGKDMQGSASELIEAVSPAFYKKSEIY